VQAKIIAAAGVIEWHTAKLFDIRQHDWIECRSPELVIASPGGVGAAVSSGRSNQDGNIEYWISRSQE
jgi:hypothetical protein